MMADRPFMRRLAAAAPAGDDEVLDARRPSFWSGKTARSCGW